jgi:hypothetical protein
MKKLKKFFSNRRFFKFNKVEKFFQIKEQFIVYKKKKLKNFL